MSNEHPAPPNSAAEWDERYGSAQRVWSAQVNPSLADEAADLPPGRALDVGSGEGADSRWLAARGWQVTAVDISRVALDRAAAIEPVSGAISWVQADLTADPVPGGPYDLVSAHYFPIPVEQSGVAQALIGAVTPGGVLLVVAHAPDGVRAHGFDPDAYVQPADFAELLGDGWSVEVLGTRPRPRPAGGVDGPRHHVEDVVLRASRHS